MADPTTMTLPEWQARQIEKAADILCTFVESTREDRLRWRPVTDEASSTRSVMEQVGECIFANRRFLSFFRGSEAPATPDSFDVYANVADAVEALKSSARELAEQVRQYETKDLMKEVTTHRGPMPVALAMQFPVRNMTYHMGQINMIQLLYGDTVFHITEEFTTL